MLYEQSLVGNTVEDDDAAAPAAAGDAAAPADGGAAAATADGAAADADPVLAELDVVRGRMEAYDAAREVVIKGVRDTQKLSKLAIYSLHRGDAAKARKQLDDALKAAAALAPQVPSSCAGAQAVRSSRSLAGCAARAASRVPVCDAARIVRSPLRQRHSFTRS